MFGYPWSEADELQFQKLSELRKESLEIGELIISTLQPIIDNAKRGILPHEFLTEVQCEEHGFLAPFKKYTITLKQ